MSKIIKEKKMKNSKYKCKQIIFESLFIGTKGIKIISFIITLKYLLWTYYLLKDNRFLSWWSKAPLLISTSSVPSVADATCLEAF